MLSAKKIKKWKTNNCKQGENKNMEEKEKITT
jgi:hypothetical protein